jgi:hypothetical protein
MSDAELFACMEHLNAADRILRVAGHLAARARLAMVVDALPNAALDDDVPLDAVIATPNP